MKTTLLILSIAICGITNAQYTKLLDLAGVVNGSNPAGSLMQASDGMLYGMTAGGGANDSGIVFQYNPSTSAYTDKLDFAGTTNGKYPVGSFMQARDGMLYGITYYGGANNLGVLFQYNPSTSTYTKKLDFAGATNGANPFGTLMQASNGMLYGMTEGGGANNSGVLFQYDPSASAYTKKLDFAGATNGSYPNGSLMQASDGMLYGMTTYGGANNMGVLFQYNPSTSTYTNKLDFAGVVNGRSPRGSLMQASDGMLYGMTWQGGANNMGVLFQYNPSTATYTNKLDFAGTTNGRYPYGSLMQASDGMLYGMTRQGGANTYGVLFQYNPSTSAYTKLLDFAGVTNGQYPEGSLMQASDGMFYGMTSKGGVSVNCLNGCGVLFKYGIATGIAENNMDNDFTVYPNPFSTQTTLQIDYLLINANLAVVNYLGQTVKEIKNISGQTITFFRDNLPSGLYFIRLTQDNKVIKSDKLVITDN